MDEEDIFFKPEDVYPAKENDEEGRDNYFSDEELAEMERHEAEKINHTKKKKASFKGFPGFSIKNRSFIKLIIILLGAAAIILYLLFSADPIASLYRRNFKTNINRLFPTVSQNKSLIDYTSDELEEKTNDDTQETEASGIMQQNSQDGNNENTTHESNIRQAVTILFDSASKTKFSRYNSGLLCASSNHIYYINKKGEVTVDKQTGIVDPILRTNGSYAVLAQEGGGKIELYENENLIYDIMTDEKIISCSVSAKGDVTLVTQRENYRGGISVYNKSGTQIFSWSSGQSNVMCAALSASSRKLAAVLANADGEVYSSIRVFNINNGSEECSFSFKDTLLFDMSFTSSVITAFGDNSMITVTQSGILISDRRFDNVDLSHFAYDMQGNKAVIFDSDNIPVMQTYNMRSSIKKEMQISELADHIDINGKYLLYNNGRDAILRREGSDTLRVYTAPMDIAGLVLLDADSFAIIHSNSVEIIRL